MNKVQGLAILGLAVLFLLTGMGFSSCEKPPDPSPNDPPPPPEECTCEEKTHLHVHFNFDEEETDETDIPDWTDEPDETDLPDETEWPDGTDGTEEIDEESERKYNPELVEKFDKCGCAANCDDCLPKITTTLSNEKTIVVKEVGVLEEEFNIFLAMFNGLYDQKIGYSSYREYSFNNNIKVIYVQKGSGIMHNEKAKSLIVGCDASWNKVYRYLLTARLLFSEDFIH